MVISGVAQADVKSTAKSDATKDDSNAENDEANHSTHGASRKQSGEATQNAQCACSRKSFDAKRLQENRQATCTNMHSHKHSQTSNDKIKSIAQIAKLLPSIRENDDESLSGLLSRLVPSFLLRFFDPERSWINALSFGYLGRSPVQPLTMARLFSLLPQLSPTQQRQVTQGLSPAETRELQKLLAKAHKKAAKQPIEKDEVDDGEC